MHHRHDWPAATGMIGSALQPRHQSLGVERVDICRRPADPSTRRSPHRDSATDRSWRSMSARAPAGAPSASASPSAMAVSRVCWPITSGTIGTPGTSAARNGNCISSECSRPCAARGSSTTPDTTAAARPRGRPSTLSEPSGVSNCPVGPHRHTVKRDEVGRADEHDDVERLRVQEPVRVSGNRTRIQSPACGATSAHGGPSGIVPSANDARAR